MNRIGFLIVTAALLSACNGFKLIPDASCGRTRAPVALYAAEDLAGEVLATLPAETAVAFIERVKDADGATTHAWVRTADGRTGWYDARRAHVSPLGGRPCF